MSDVVIDIADTRKRYRGGVEALRGVSLQVPKGGIFGLLGPNGAGKSTLVKILMSIVRPNHCSGTMLGAPIGHKPTLARVGYLPEHARFPEYLKGAEVIRYVAGLTGISRTDAAIKAEQLLEIVGMQDWGKRRMRTYSKGMKQRIGLAQALVNDPEIVFLDEPTDGVDPQGRLEMRQLLRRMRDEGRTVFINSHLLGELEMICDGVAIMDKGEIVEQGTIAQLTAKSCRYELITRGDLSEGLLSQLRAQGVEIRHQSGRDLLSVCGSDPEPIQPILDALRAEGVIIVELRELRQSLEELFMQSVGTGGVGGNHKGATPPSLPGKEVLK